MTYVLIVHIEELLEFDAAIRERAERPPLLQLGGHGRVGNDIFRLQGEQRQGKDHNITVSK